MVRWKALLFLGLAMVAQAQDLRKLPDWAQAAAAEVAGKPLPEADAWIVLDRTEMAYTGDGEIRTRKFRLAKIISERGLNEASYWLRGLGGKTSKVKKLKGWNLRPDGELVKLSDDWVATLGASSALNISTDQVTIAFLPRATKGSWVAFESQEVFNYPMGPFDVFGAMEVRPIHRWELSLAKQEGWFTDLKQVMVHLDIRHFQPWVKGVELESGKSLKILDLPGFPEDESAHPAVLDVLPSVLVRFEDPKLKEIPSIQSWDLMAQHFQDRYAERFSAKSEMGISDKDPLKVVQAIQKWMTRELTYRQVYLSPERGWIPEFVSETLRKRYGDCKDLASCFISEARIAGLKSYPVLARIVEGHAAASDPVSFLSFNHVIAAVKLEQTLGFPAEIDTPKGRFLLVDPTDRFAPAGTLHAGHRGREVLICTETGGIWVRIPQAAVMTPLTKVTLDGDVLPTGHLDATMTLEEVADGAGLRQACIGRGPQKMREYLLESFLDLPPTGTLEVLKVGDAFDVDHPFVVSFKFSHPDGFHLQGGEGVLATLGLPAVPNPIQKAGKPRQYPVQWNGVGKLDYRARIRLPWRANPVLPALSAQTPFRSVEWTAKAVVADGKSTLELTFHQQRKDAFFDFIDREKGLLEWKKDRNQIKTLLNDGLAFKLNP